MKLTIVLAAGLAAGANAFRAAPRRRLRVTCAAAVEGGRVARVDLGVEDVAKARGFYEACGLTGESALGFGPADGHAALGLQDGVADAGDGFRGLVLHLAEAESVADAAANAGGAVVAPLEDKEIGPSLVPDEPVDKTTLITVGQLSDPSSNPVTLLRKRRRDGLAGVALRVLDLQETTAFWEGALGMVLLRQRSNVPDEASMSSFMGYDAADESADGGFIVELRYEYGDAPVRAGDIVRLTVTTNDVAAAAAGAAAYITDAGMEDKASVETREDGTAVVTDPNGYVVELVDAVDYMMANM